MDKTLPLRIFAILLLITLLGEAVGPLAPAQAQADVPTTVAIPGTLQSELGCSGDWQPDCDKTFLVYDAEDDVWQGTFLVQPNNDQDNKGSRYKVALDKSWTVNFGMNAAPGGADIPLEVTDPTKVKFYYDHKTHWVADDFNNLIAVAIGSFQTELGCLNDDDPTCLRGWLQDPEGTGTFTFSTRSLPAGDYTYRVAVDESSAQVYGVGGEQDGEELGFSVDNDGDEIYFAYDSTTGALVVSTSGAPRGNINKPLAQWVQADSILWQISASSFMTFKLHYALEGGMELTNEGVVGGETIPLTYKAGIPAASILEKYPHLLRYSVFNIDPASLAKVPEALKGQLAISAYDEEGKLVGATGIQSHGALDDLFTYDGPLGVTFDGDTPTLRLWAPTAQAVTLHLFPDASGDVQESLAMTADPQAGIWSITGEPDWDGLYYLYDVQVYVPSTGKVETNLVTDPYSFSLSMNSLRSQVVNLQDPDLQPQDWDATPKPALAAFEDSVLYELHIRDFSVSDESVPEALRGTYLAFTQADSNGMQHLAGLAQAGLTHVHLLPAFDIASINEDKSTWQDADPVELASFPPDSDQQQTLLAPFRDQEGFNWGYDPFHYTTPEGSYATSPDGAVRILEFRQMVQALNQAGLRVVMDVVYNHTNASGQEAKSVLDKVVPGYYHRLNAEGAVETSTCCQNTATEHAMMEKLMIDSLVTWAKEYKVDGFRFDLMGHHMVENMLHVRQALDALTLEKDGVDGSKILIYGEGWDFGEVAGSARGTNATQLNLAGAGIATFNDRLRDAARGGGPFNPVQEQGFITGLFDAPNSYAATTTIPQLQRLMEYESWIRIGLAGNLVDYQVANPRGKVVAGKLILYNGNPAAYTLDPQEQIVYVSAHDNETLFDAIQYKAPEDATIEDRVRMNNLGIDLVMLSQGIPFFHAGDELLRSKSLDGNSYNSGDWYNRLDFTYQTNNWGVGLPNFRQDSWDLMRSLLGDPALQAKPEDIQFALAHFKEMLQVRKSSPLFRLQTAQDVIQRVFFLNQEREGIPGLIVMVLDDASGIDLDPSYARIVVAFNATSQPITFADPSLAGLELALHPIQSASADPVVRQAAFDSTQGTLIIPGRTTAVFVAVSAPPLALPQQVSVVPTPTTEPTAAPTPTAKPAAAPTEPPAAQPTEAPAVPTAEPGATGLPTAGILGGIAVLLAAVVAGWWWMKRKNSG